MQFRPLHDRVVVRRLEAEEKTAGGIIIPDTAKEKPMEGEVIAVGPGARDESGKPLPLDVKPKDLDPRRSRSPKKRTGSVAAKYRDPASGTTWSGRGKPPRWIADQDREKFAITD